MAAALALLGLFILLIAVTGTPDSLDDLRLERSGVPVPGLVTDTGDHFVAVSYRYPESQPNAARIVLLGDDVGDFATGETVTLLVDHADGSDVKIKGYSDNPPTVLGMCAFVGAVCLVGAMRLGRSKQVTASKAGEGAEVRPDADERAAWFAPDRADVAVEDDLGWTPPAIPTSAWLVDAQTADAT